MNFFARALCALLLLSGTQVAVSFATEQQDLEHLAHSLQMVHESALRSPLTESAKPQTRMERIREAAARTAARFVGWLKKFGERTDEQARAVEGVSGNPYDRGQ